MRNSLGNRIAACLTTSALTIIPLTAQADTASQLTSITGMDAGDAEDALQRRGFTFYSSNNTSMGYTNSLWWDEGDDDCITVEAYDGRIMTINDAADQDCGHHSGANAEAAVAVVAGAAILGALFSHRGSHHEEDQHSQDTASETAFERGYQDGLHGGTYHNSDRSEAYSSGYSAGDDERNANLRHHTGHSGYQQAVSYSDLQGARAAGAMSDIESRGFEQVDNFTSGNTRYSIQWNRQTHQCLQMTIADGRIYDIRDIGQNPNCR